MTQAPDTTTVPADGSHTTNGIPHGVTSLTPFLAVPRAQDAIAFYRDIFGARVVDVTEMGGVVAHAVLDFGHGRLQLGEPNTDYHLLPPPDDDACYSMGFYYPNGATVREPLTTFVSGDRFAGIKEAMGS